MPSKCVQIVAIFLLLLHSSSRSASTQFQNCSSTFKCGSLDANLWYPFWAEPRPQYCGHPDFKLSCPAQTTDPAAPTIKIGSQTLTVANVSMDRQSMTLLLPAADPCPKTPSNMSLYGRLNLHYTTSVQNVTFSYDCSSSYEGEANGSFTCPLGSGYLGGKTAYYNYDATSINPIIPLKKCEVNVVVPMLERGVEKMRGDYASVVEGFKEGFEVDWSGLQGEDSCKTCISSGGACGHNWTSDAPVCFCEPNGGGVCSSNLSSWSVGNIAPTDSNGYDTNALSSPPPPSSGAVGAGAGLTAVLASAGFILYRRRQHKKPRHDQALANAVSQPRIHGSTPDDSFVGVNLFSYDELEEATEYFNPSKELGEGGFGTVYHGKLVDGREVAIKRMFENNSKRVQQFMNEIEMLTHLRHKNLVSLYGCTSRHSRELLLVYEYVANGTVADHLHGRKPRVPPNDTAFSPLSWSTRLSIAVETSNALVYLHASGIIHRDVKTNNILLDDHSSVKVADFGLSRLFPLDLTHVSTAPQGTPGYVDPEYHQCYQLTDKSDVYSFGVVLVELISTKPAVDITRHRHEINLSNHAINKIQSGTLHELVDPALGFDVDARIKREVTMVAELAFQCLQHDRDMRPTMDEVLEVLTRIQDHNKEKTNDNENKLKMMNYMGSMKAEVVDIPPEEALRLKSDLSPGSSSGSKGKIHDTTSHSC